MCWFLLVISLASFTSGDESDTLFTIRDIGSGDVAVDVVGVINYELQDRHTFNIEVRSDNVISPHTYPPSFSRSASSMQCLCVLMAPLPSQQWLSQ